MKWERYASINADQFLSNLMELLAGLAITSHSALATLPPPCSFARMPCEVADRPPEAQEQDMMISGRQLLLLAVALVAGLTILVAGLSSLWNRPLEGALMIIVGMASLLYSADGFCQGPGVFQTIEPKE
jgi:hypothetical protein